MMSRAGARFKYLEDDSAQVLEMPYAGGQLSMLWVLPKHDLAALEKSLDAGQLQRWQSQLAPRQVDVFVPKFTARADAEMKLTLAAMGMPRVFSSSADLSAMDGSRELSLSEVFHQVFIEVNEEGSEAAAATAAVAVIRSARQAAVFRADRPLLFLIQDNSTGLVLFFGRLVDPRG
jgi:serpin B